MHGNGGTKKFEFVSVCRSSVDETFTRKIFEFVFHVMRHKSSKRIRLSRILKCTDHLKPGILISLLRLRNHVFSICIFGFFSVVTVFLVSARSNPVSS